MDRDLTPPKNALRHSNKLCSIYTLTRLAEQAESEETVQYPFPSTEQNLVAWTRDKLALKHWAIKTPSPPPPPRSFCLCLQMNAVQVSMPLNLLIKYMSYLPPNSYIRSCQRHRNDMTYLRWISLLLLIFVHTHTHTHTHTHSHTNRASCWAVTTDSSQGGVVTMCLTVEGKSRLSMPSLSFAESLQHWCS